VIVDEEFFQFPEEFGAKVVDVDRMKNKKRSSRKVRYALVGLGHLAQVAVLPAFAALENAELGALVTLDKRKARVLGDATNSCILCTAHDANMRYFKVTVVSEGFVTLESLRVNRCRSLPCVSVPSGRHNSQLKGGYGKDR